MEFFSGLDVRHGRDGDLRGGRQRQGGLADDGCDLPEAFKAALRPYLGRLRRVGHEAGTLSPRLHPELLKLGLPAMRLETQRVRAALKAQRNKTEGGCLGIAHLMRTGWFRTAHIKSEACYRVRLLLTHRSLAPSERTKKSPLQRHP
jgi:transposase